MPRRSPLAALAALLLLFFVATVVLDGGGGAGDSMGGKGEMFSTLSGHGMLDKQTDRTDESKSLQEEIAKAVEQVQPLDPLAVLVGLPPTNGSNRI